MTCTPPVRRTDCRSKAVRLFGRNPHSRSVLVGARWNLQMAIGEMASAVLFIPNKRSRIVRYLLGVNLWGEWYLKLTRPARLVKGILSGYRVASSALIDRSPAHTSHLGYFHSSARRASSRAALSATYLADDTPCGKRWIFQDVHSGGAASMAGIAPGNILVTVDGWEIASPEHPVFSMVKQTSMEVIAHDVVLRNGSAAPGRPIRGIDCAFRHGVSENVSNHQLHSQNRSQ